MDSKTKLPPLEELEGILKLCEEAHDKASSVNLNPVEMTYLINGLRWMTKFIEERRLYHRKHNYRKTAFANLMKEHMADDEKAAVEDQVDEKLLERIETSFKEGDDEAA